MLTTTPARVRERTRRTLLAAVVAACALPAAAQASFVEESSDGILKFRAAAGEVNSLNIVSNGGGIDVIDLTGVTSRTPLCASVSPVRVRCAIGARLTEATLGDRNDGFAIAVSERITVDGGTGNDAFTGGATAGVSRVRFFGGSGFDTALYERADRGVRVTPTGFDGRPGIDEDIIAGDVERIVGSRFGDQLTSLNPGAVLNGSRGDDVLTGTPTSVTTFDMGRQADGADRIVPGGNVSFVDYSQRTLPVNVTLGFRGADDGEAGERDEIQTGGDIFVEGGQAGDTLSTFGSVIGDYFVRGNGGGDRLEGGESGETLEGGAGEDTYLANGGNDVVHAIDGVGEFVACGGGTDTADLDSRDGFSSCENPRVGALGLAPRTVRAEAGERFRMRLSWRHPRDWRRLRAITLRLTHDGVPVGEITIRPRGERIGATGAVRLVRRATRLTRRGTTVSARLALRLDASLTGRTLRADVEATDRRGARQLERAAATVRVAP